MIVTCDDIKPNIMGDICIIIVLCDDIRANIMRENETIVYCCIVQQPSRSLLRMLMLADRSADVHQ